MTVDELRSSRDKIKEELTDKLDQVNLIRKEISNISTALAKFCKKNGHTWNKSSHCISGHGHFWNCSDCHHEASGRHLSRPHPFHDLDRSRVR